MNVIDFANQLFCILMLACSLRILAIQITHDQNQSVKQENVRRKWRELVKQVIIKNQTDHVANDHHHYENAINRVPSDWNTVFIHAIHHPLNIVLIPLRIVFSSQYNVKEEGYSM
jgi:hypothetical protein